MLKPIVLRFDLAIVIVKSQRRLSNESVNWYITGRLEEERRIVRTERIIGDKEGYRGFFQETTSRLIIS